MHHIGSELIPLRTALYGPDGLFPRVRRADVSRVFGRPLRRRSGAGFMVEYVRKEDVERIRRKIQDQLKSEISLFS